MLIAHALVLDRDNKPIGFRIRELTLRKELIEPEDSLEEEDLATSGAESLADVLINSLDAGVYSVERIKATIKLGVSVHPFRVYEDKLEADVDNLYDFETVDESFNRVGAEREYEPCILVRAWSGVLIIMGSGEHEFLNVGKCDWLPNIKFINCAEPNNLKGRNKSLGEYGNLKYSYRGYFKMSNKINRAVALYGTDISINTNNGDITLVGGNGKSLTIPKGLRRIKSYTRLGNERNFASTPIVDRSFGDISIGGYVNIDSAGFSWVSGRTVNIEDGIHYIGNDAFYRSSIGKVIIPNSVKSIEEAAFAWMKDSIVELPDGVEIIPKECFKGTSGMKSIRTPANTKIIGRSAYSSMGEVEDIEISDGVLVICDKAFHGTGVSGDKPAYRVRIPQSVRLIHAGAFNREVGNPILVIEDGARTTIVRDRHRINTESIIVVRNKRSFYDRHDWIEKPSI